MPPGLGFAMACSIIYLRGTKWVGDARWTGWILPPCSYVRDSLKVRDADTAIITSEEGRYLTIRDRQKLDA